MLTRLGLRLPSRIDPDGGCQGFEELAGLAETAEDSGFDSVWVCDHSDGVPGGMLEAYTLLGALAVNTRKARLGALASSVTGRSPGILAKQVTAVDVLSKGRAALGVSPGIEEARRGVSQEEREEQYDRFEEALEVIGSLLGKGKLDEEEVSFSGRFYQLDRAPNRPRPLQEGTLPVLIAVSAASEMDTLKLVARYADACGLMGDSVGLHHQLSALDGHLADLDRDPLTLSRIALVPIGSSPADDLVERLTEDVAAYRELGIDGVIVLLPVTWNKEMGSESLSAVDLVSSIGHSLQLN